MISNNDIGSAGEYLVMSHLRSMGVQCAQVGSEHIDLVAYIGDAWRAIQVKASVCQRNFSGGGTFAGGLAAKKKFTDYTVDAFVFCFLPAPFPYYIARQAVDDSINLPAGAFTRAGRDMSWGELLRRFGVTQEIAAGQLV